MEWYLTPFKATDHENLFTCGIVSRASIIAPVAGVERIFNLAVHTDMVPLISLKQ